MADALGFRRKRAIAALGLSFLLEEEAQQPRKRSRKVYMRDWIALREERGIYHQLVKELETGDRVAYKEFFRMTKQQFCFLVEKVSPLIEKKQQPSPINSVRSTIKPDERLAVTLRYLATGESFHSLEYSFRISRQSISSIVYETSRALYQVLVPEFLKVPSTERVADIGRQIRVQVKFSSWHWCNWRETGDHPATTQLGLPFLRLQRKQQHCPPRCLWAWLPVHLGKCGNEWP